MNEPKVATQQEIPPWLFAPLAAVHGIAYWGVCALVIPYLLRKHGVAVDRIAGVVATASIPTFCYFLWAPIIDLGLRRRTWILLCSGAVALCSTLAVAGSAGSLTWVTIFLTASNAIGSVGSAAIGALMAAQPAAIRGRASGWFQAGNVGLGSLGGGAFIWLADRMGLPALSCAVAAAVFLPALAAYRVTEPPHPPLPAALLFSALGRDIRDILWSWRTLVGLVFFASPVGAGAVGNLISSVGRDYHASGTEVAWVSGLGGSVLLALGAFAGGFVCDRIHRMSAYAVSGLIAAVFGAWLALGPATPFTFGAGYAGYALSTGFAYTAFTSLVLDVLGHGRRAAATGYSVLLSFGNFPVAYMTWVDGVGYRHGGARGLMGVDALANGVCGVLLLVVARLCARRWIASSAPPAAFAVAAD